MTVVRYIKHLLAPSNAQLADTSVARDVSTVPVLERMFLRL